MPVDYLDTSGANKTTQIGLARAHPNDLDTPGRILFSGLGAGLSYVSSRRGTNGREIFSFDSDLMPFMVDLTNSEYDIILMDPRGVRSFCTESLTLDWLVECTDMWIYGRHHQRSSIVFSADMASYAEFHRSRRPRLVCSFWTILCRKRGSKLPRSHQYPQRRTRSGSHSKSHRC